MSKEKIQYNTIKAVCVGMHAYVCVLVHIVCELGGGGVL